MDSFCRKGVIVLDDYRLSAKSLFAIKAYILYIRARLVNGQPGARSCRLKIDTSYHNVCRFNVLLVKPSTCRIFDECLCERQAVEYKSEEIHF